MGSKHTKAGRRASFRKHCARSSMTHTHTRGRITMTVTVDTRKWVTALQRLSAAAQEIAREMTGGAP